MRVFNLVRGLNCSRLNSRSVLFLLVSLLMLGQPLDSKAQETQDPPLLEVKLLAKTMAGVHGGPSR